MKNIVTVNDTEKFLRENIWKTDIFKNLHKNNLFFKSLINKLNESPIYFFDLSHEKGRNHLTSIFRFIPFRQYSNPYINDLYYLHELCHCANYELKDLESMSYQEWSNKLSSNELFASLVSEVFIYFMDPELVDKTFSPLWAERFVNPIINDINYDNNNGLLPYQNDKQWRKKVEHLKSIDSNNKLTDKEISLNLLSLDQKNWPNYINNIIKRREELRKITIDDDLEVLDSSERVIVNYNLSHQKWIQLWTDHYINIDSALIKLKNKEIDAESFKEYIVNNCDEFGRPFFPRKKKTYTM